jgi:DNA-binding NtrC family response regulator
VDTDAAFATELHSVVQRAAAYEVIVHTQFEAARQQVAVQPPHLLVANVRLESFNGIHLVYLAKSSGSNVRVVIYAEQHDSVLAREAQRAGAFYERQFLLPYSLQGLINAELPPLDRRESDFVDRRTMFRGGRRVTDLAALHLAQAGV